MEAASEHAPLLSRLRTVALNVGAALLEGFARMDPGYTPVEPLAPGSEEYINQRVEAFRRDIGRM
jgi:hypothetical protein